MSAVLPGWLTFSLRAGEVQDTIAAAVPTVPFAIATTPPLVGERESPAPAEMPEAVANARVLAGVTRRSADGARLTVQVIEPPAFPPMEAVAAPVVQALSAAERAARKAAAPTEFRLFSPTVTVHGNGVSRVRWWSMDRFTGFQEYAGWVNQDLSSLDACGDLTVGKRRYCLLTSTHAAGDRFTAKETPPAPGDFQTPTDIILTHGDPGNTAALEPLVALLEKYDREGALIDAAAAARRADREARAAWEAAHPAPPAETVIRFWPVRSTEYSTAAPVK